MKIIKNQQGNMFLAISESGTQMFSVAPVKDEPEGREAYSVGVGDISLGIYSYKEKALDVLNNLCDYMTDSGTAFHMSNGMTERYR